MIRERPQGRCLLGPHSQPPIAWRPSSTSSFPSTTKAATSWRCWPRSSARWRRRRACSSATTTPRTTRCPRSAPTHRRTPGCRSSSCATTPAGACTAPFVLMFPADDHVNAPMLDRMVALARGGCDIVCASRFMPGGAMIHCPWLKAALVRSANFTLHHVARLPTTDASNGFRMFSRRVIDRIAVESTQGFCYSIELLVKAHRLGWTIAEVPVTWIERESGESRFRVLKWLPAYLRWYGYAFATTFLRRPPRTVALKEPRR